MEASNIDLNLQSLKEIQEENPATSHIYMRREDGTMVDIPLAHAEFTIRNNPTWVVEGGAVPKIELAVKPAEDGATDELPILPPRPSEETMQEDDKSMQSALIPPAKPKAKPVSKKTKAKK